MKLHLPTALVALLLLPAFTVKAEDIIYDQDTTVEEAPVVSEDTCLRIQNGAKVKVTGDLEGDGGGTISLSSGSSLFVDGSVFDEYPTASLESQGGNAELRAVRDIWLAQSLGNDVKIVSQEGKVFIDDVSSAGSNVISAGQGIRLHNLSAEFAGYNLSTASGDIFIREDVKNPYSLTAVSGNGSVILPIVDMAEDAVILEGKTVSATGITAAGISLKAGDGGISLGYAVYEEGGGIPQTPLIGKFEAVSGGNINIAVNGNGGGRAAISAESAMLRSEHGNIVLGEDVMADLDATAVAGTVTMRALKGSRKGTGSVQGESVTMSSFEGGALHVSAKNDIKIAYGEQSVSEAVRASSAVLHSDFGDIELGADVIADLDATAAEGMVSLGFLKGTDKGLSKLEGERVMLAAFEGGELSVKARGHRTDSQDFQGHIVVLGNLNAKDKGITLTSEDGSVEFRGVLQAAGEVNVSAYTDIQSNYPGSQMRNSAARLTFISESGNINIENGIEGQLAAAAESGRVTLADVYLTGETRLEASLTPLGAKEIIGQGTSLVTARQVQIQNGLHVRSGAKLVLGGETHVDVDEESMPSPTEAADGKAYISSLHLEQNATVQLRNTSAHLVLEDYAATTYLTAKSDTVAATVTRTGSEEDVYEAESTAFEMHDMLVNTELGSFTLNNRLYNVSGHFSEEQMPAAGRAASNRRVFYLADLTVEAGKESSFSNTTGVSVSSSLVLEGGASMAVTPDEVNGTGLLTMGGKSTLTVGQGGAALQADLLVQTGATIDFGGVLTLGGSNVELKDGVLVFLSDALWQNVKQTGYTVVMSNVDSATLGSGTEPYYVYDNTVGTAERSKYYLAYIEADRTVVVIPEPMTATLSLLGLAALLRRRRR